MGKMQEMSRRKQSNPDAEAFGAIVRRLRTKRGLTQERLAELADLNVSYIGFLERGENVPTLTIVLNLARALGVHAADLVREVERKR
jgi:transcriptional regulator with XRE-family HTH domain